MPRSAVQLSGDDARRIALRAQGLVGRPDRRAGADGVVRALGAVQLDTISVLARSHELVVYARLGPVGRAAVEPAYWSRPPRSFEYWAHAASILPIEDWPWYAMRRARNARRLDGSSHARRAVLARLESDGPLTARGLGGARQGGPWWDWSPLKRAAEELLAAGDVVCVERPSAIPAIARAMVEAGRWVGCHEVTIERVGPPECEAPLRAALRAATRAM